MKCKNCGGELKYENNTWKCTSCGRQFSVSEYCNEIDVYICYSETDENGRRTNDSVIAQEIYHLLEQNGIKSFYKRTSLENYSGSDAVNMDEAALNQANMILFLGTSTDVFQSLWEKYGRNSKNKKIIPICHGIEAKDLPKEMNRIQAIKYDRVGSSSDLLSAVFRMLGRQKDNSQSFTEMAQNRQTKKKKIIVSVVMISIIAIVVVAIAIKKSVSDISESNDNENTSFSDENKTDNEPTLIDINELYASGIEYMEDGRYADAIEAFSETGDYKDSQNKVRICYAKYEGYYQDERTGVTIQLQNLDENGIIIIQSSDEGKQCTIDQAVRFEGKECKFIFVDSEGNTGESSVVLNNSGFVLTIKNKKKSSSLYVTDAEIDFSIEDKSDQSYGNRMSLNTIREVLSEKTTLGDLKRMGYDYQFEQPLMDFAKTGYYRIKDTDVMVAAYEYDLNKAYKKKAPSGYPTFENPINNVDDCIIYGIKAPAYIVAPDRIGQTVDPYIDGDYMFIPECDFDDKGTFYYSRYNWESDHEIEKEIGRVISNDTYFLICSDNNTEIEYYEALKQAFNECVTEMNDTERQITNTGIGNDSYIISDSSSRYLTEDDIKGMTNDDLRKARNEIVARHGRRFQDKELQAYFDTMPWYNGTIEPDDFDMNSILSDIEKENMDFIKKHEK